MIYSKENTIGLIFKCGSDLYEVIGYEDDLIILQQENGYLMRDNADNNLRVLNANDGGYVVISTKVYEIF